MKRLLLAVAFVATIVSAQAQISAGAKAGLNLATFGGDAEDAKMRPSFHIGGYLNVGITENLSFQPELLYNSIGAKFEESETEFGATYEYESTFKLSYISLPLNVQYSFGNFSVHLGPQVSFLASAKQKFEERITFNGDTETESGEEDIKDGVKGIDLGLNVGLGYNFGKFGITGRYTAGLSNIVDDSDDDDKLTNNVIQLSLGYRFMGGDD